LHFNINFREWRRCARCGTRFALSRPWRLKPALGVSV
jgi:hypothetical protein